MAKIFTSREDEDTMTDVLNKGLQIKAPKWTVMRLALAHSLRIPSPPDTELDRVKERGSEYGLEQVTGQGQGRSLIGQQLDLTDAFRGLLTVYSGEDLFVNDKSFFIHLQRHIRRGLREFRRSWRENHDFYQFLYQELCAGQDREVGAEIIDFAQQLVTALNEIGVTGEVSEEPHDGPRITRYLVRLEDPNHLDRVRRGLDKISFIMGLQKHGVFPVETGQPKVIGLDIPRPRNTWKTISGQDLLGWIKKHSRQDTSLPMWPGVSVTGEPILFDLARQPHLLVGGTTGSGKSICLHALLISLLVGVARERLQLVLIDPKKVEFAPYAKAGSKRITVITDVEDAKTKLEALVAEMESRTTALEQAGVRDLAEGHRKGVLKIPYIVVFVEELADLVMQAPEAEEHMIRLAQKARATGIHLVIATQRPDARILNGLLRSNIPSRIALTVQKSTESKIILDETGAERLTGAGDMLIRLSGQPVQRVHGVYVTDDDSAAVIRSEGVG
ncbi:MAG: FtsK/SpoIIIE domain-containing protein [Magnetococcus sp. YQC-5]